MTEWHVPTDVLSQFGSAPASLDDAVAASVETHLIACTTCRVGLTELVPPDQHRIVQQSWAEVVDRIDLPRRAFVERLLNVVGVRSDLARVVASSRALQLAWAAATAVVAVAAVVLSHLGDAADPFLVIAPLAPLAAVAATFAPTADPAGEVGVAAPMHGGGLVVIRTVAVLAPTFLILALAATGLPNVDIRSAAWVLPGLALSVGALSLGTRWRLEFAAVGLAFVWLAALAGLTVIEGARTVADLAPFAPVGQLAAVVLATIAALVLSRRIHLYSTLEVAR